MIFQDFDALISSLHKGTGTISDAEFPDTIFIDAHRQFIFPDNYDTNIAYEGDVNSQIVTFDCPLLQENHILRDCDHKKIRWTNLSSGIEGRSDLKIVEKEAADGRWFLQWEIPPEALTKSGTLEFSISIYDLDDNGYVAFQWNTSNCKRLTVSATMAGIEVNRPARDEVLLIDADTRRIIQPSGYNGIIANYGDIGTSKVFFRVKRYVRGIDVLDQGTIRTIRWKIGDQVQSTTEGIFIKNYSSEIDEKNNIKEGLVDITWNLPEEITCNNQHYAGSFSIDLSFTSQDGKRNWGTSIFNGLSIGKNLFMTSPSSLPGSEGYYIINGDGINGTGVNTEIAGIFTLKSFDPQNASQLKKNELAVEYDENGNYVGLKVGTNNAGEDASKAVYIDKIMQGETIILDGGNASGNQED